MATPLQYSCLKKNPHEQRNLVGYSLKSCRVRHDWGAPEHTEHNNQIDNNNNSSNDNNRMLVLSTYCVPDSVLWTLTELSQWQGRKCHFYLVDEENVMRDISRVSWHPSQDVAVKIQGQNKQTKQQQNKAKRFKAKSPKLCSQNSLGLSASSPTSCHLWSLNHPCHHNPCHLADLEFQNPPFYICQEVKVIFLLSH